MDTPKAFDPGNYFRIFFRMERDEDGWPLAEGETIWAERTEEGYRIDNMPLFAPDLAHNDIVEAELVDGNLEFRNVVRHAGHGTLHLVATDVGYIPRMKKDIEELGCAWAEGPIEIGVRGQRFDCSPSWCHMMI